MHEIKCPHCKKEFKLDDAGYAEIMAQVKTDEFEKELHDRLAAAEKLKDAQVKAAESELRQKLESESAKRAAKDAEEIAKLNAQLEKTESEKKLAVSNAVQELEKEKSKAENALELAKVEGELALKNQVAESEAQKRLLEGQVAFYKEMKALQSNKILGESLEQHCQTEFTRIRSAAFPNAKFGKDNTVEGGTKGDYIFRDYTEKDVEIVSIMFEMKNEFDESVNKKKNEEFLEKLHKDRVKKNCEYAILVTQLEPNSDLYNSGIVDVSHIYPKMYVIRPQFFIPMITLLLNAAKGVEHYKTQLELARRESSDITNFEEKLKKFKGSMEKNWKDYSANAEASIRQIDDAIRDLEAVKESLRLAMKHLGSLSNNADKITIRKLTSESPSIAAKFKEIGMADDSGDA